MLDSASEWTEGPHSAEEEPEVQDVTSLAPPLTCANNAAMLPMLPVLVALSESFLPTYLPACFLFACLLTLSPALPF